MKQIIKTLAMCSMMVLALSGLWGCNEEQAEAPKEEKKEETIAVVVTPVTPSDFIETSEYFGKVQATQEATLVSHTGGKVNSLKVKNGQNVSKGQKLCDIEGDKFDNLLEAAKIQESIAKQELERAQRHSEAGNYSELQLNQAKQQLLNAEYQRIEAQKNWEAAYCVSPISGQVINHSIENHQNLPPGSPTVEIADLRKLKIILDVPESDIDGVDKGNNASVLVKENSILKGSVYSLSQKIVSSSKTFSVEVRLNNDKKELKPGQTVRVRLEKKLWKDAIVIPSICILSLKNEHYVYVVSEGKAKRIPVEKGPSNAEETLILSGLSPEDSLITSGYALVSEGTPVKIQ